MNNEQEFLELIIKEIVAKPDKVKITRKIDELGVLYLVNVDEIDLPKVIGKKGNIAQAIRLLLKAVGFKHGVRASMKIETPDHKHSLKK